MGYKFLDDPESDAETNMDRLVFLCCVFLILVHVIFADNNEKTVDEYVKRKQTSPLWFGPRMGRRKRNQHIDDFEILFNSDCDQLEEYIRSIPWSMVEKCAIIEDKRDKTKSKQFSPRLGRESGEEINGPISDKWLQSPIFTGELSQRSPPFAPRLGRRVMPFTPRLGRETFISL